MRNNAYIQKKASFCLYIIPPSGCPEIFPGRRQSTPIYTVIPNVSRFFYTLKSDMDLSTTQTIPVGEFVDDNGITCYNFPFMGKNAYGNLYINGIMQQGSLYEIQTNALVIKKTGDLILSGTTIIIETVKLEVWQA